MFEFSYPWLVVLLPLPYLVWRYVQPAEKSAITVFMSHANHYTGRDHTPSKYRPFLWIFSVVWLLLLVSVMRPLYVGKTQTIEQPARDVMLAVDISSSMSKQDMYAPNIQRTISRLRTVKIAMQEFIEKRKGDRVGLVLFGDKAYLQVPLTLDTTAVWQFLREAEIGLAGKNTAIGDAIGLAVKKLTQADNAHSVIVLLTDGADTASTLAPLEAATIAQKMGIKIYTIGMVPEQNSRSLLSLFSGGGDLDERLLQEIANKTGGLYFRASNWQQLSEIYNEINNLETVVVKSRSMRPEKELHYYPLAVALLLCLASFLFYFSSVAKPTNSL